MEEQQEKKPVNKKKIWIPIAAGVAVAAAVGIAIGIASCSQTVTEGGGPASSGAESAVLGEEDWMDDNANLTVSPEILTVGQITLHYPVLSHMDVPEKQEALNAVLLQDAQAFLEQNFAGSDGGFSGVLDFSQVYRTRQYLSFICMGTLVSESSPYPRVVYYVTNLDLQTGKRAETPVRGQAQALAETIRSGEGYGILTTSQETMQAQKAYLTGLSQEEIAATLAQCNFTEEGDSPLCFSYPLGQDNFAIYYPVPHSMGDYAIIQIRTDGIQ